MLARAMLHVDTIYYIYIYFYFTYSRIRNRNGNIWLDLRFYLYLRCCMRIYSEAHPKTKYNNNSLYILLFIRKLNCIIQFYTVCNIYYAPYFFYIETTFLPRIFCALSPLCLKESLNCFSILFCLCWFSLKFIIFQP